MGIHCDDDDSPTSARIMSSLSKYQAHRRAVEAQPQKSTFNRSTVVYVNAPIVSNGLKEH